MYDHLKTEAKIRLYQNLRARNDVVGLTNFLRKDLIKNSGGVANVELYKVMRNGTKTIIE